MTYSKIPSFLNQEPDSLINKVSAHLVVFPDDKQAYQSGSCCRIAKNLYLTAAHVITDWIKKFGNGVEIWAIHTEKGPKYSIWVVDAAWLNPVSDLAIFHTKPYNDTAEEATEWQCIALELHPPVIGERVVGFGRHSPEHSITFDKSGTKHIVINSPCAATVGEVRAIHPEMRDPARLKFPCFQVNARFDGGMSGGPVFNDRGNVCGIICSNLPPQSDDEEHVSYATTLWPLMLTYITIAPDGIECPPYPLIKLAQEGIIQAFGHDLVQILTNDKGETQIKFTPRY